MSPGLHCTAYSIAPGVIEFEIRNDLNRVININNAETEIIGSITDMANVSNCEADPVSNVGSGAVTVITCTDTVGTAGSRYQGQIIVGYTFGTSSLVNRHTGTISGEII